MTSINNMISAQHGLIPQVTGYLTHARFWVATYFLNTTQITATPTWWEEPHQRRLYTQRMPTDFWLPRMEPESAPIDQKIEDSQIPPSRKISGASNQLMWSGISSPERNSGAQDQGTYPRQPETNPICHHIVARGCNHHTTSFILQGSLSKWMNKEVPMSRNLPMWTSKFYQQSTTPGAAQYFSLYPPWKEGQPGFQSGNQQPGLEYT